MDQCAESGPHSSCQGIKDIVDRWLLRAVPNRRPGLAEEGGGSEELKVSLPSRSCRRPRSTRFEDFDGSSKVREGPRGEEADFPFSPLFQPRTIDKRDLRPSNMSATGPAGRISMQCCLSHTEFSEKVPPTAASMHKVQQTTWTRAADAILPTVSRQHTRGMYLVQEPLSSPAGG